MEDENKVGKGEALRKRLIATLTANLAIHAPDRAGKFECPVCAGLFPPNAVEGPTPKVNIAHVFPQAAGGRIVTLACASCNTRLSLFDYHLIKAQKTSRIMCGEIPVKGELTMGGAAVAATVHFPGTAGLSIQIHEPSSKPNELAALGSHLSSRPGKLQGRFTFQTFHRDKYNAGLTAAAFFALFRIFGYEFALAPAAQPLRQKLATAKNGEDIPKSALIRVTGASDDELLAIGAVGVFANEERGYLGAMLPEPEAGDAIAFVAPFVLWGEPSTEQEEYLIFGFSGDNSHSNLSRQDASVLMQVMISEAFEATCKKIPWVATEPKTGEA